MGPPTNWELSFHAMSSKGKRDYWFFGSYAVTQISIQLIGMVCGFLIIRQLPKEQFSLFTIFNTALATLNILGTVGLAVLSSRSRVH